MPPIKLKPKSSVDRDATNVAPVVIPAGKPFRSSADRISQMTDKELKQDALDKSIKGGPRFIQSTDSLINRKIKKNGGYEKGTKGIKLKAKKA